MKFTYPYLIKLTTDCVKNRVICLSIAVLKNGAKKTFAFIR